MRLITNANGELEWTNEPEPVPAAPTPLPAGYNPGAASYDSYNVGTDNYVKFGDKYYKQTGPEYNSDGQIVSMMGYDFANPLTEAQVSGLRMGDWGAIQRTIEPEYNIDDGTMTGLMGAGLLFGGLGALGGALGGAEAAGSLADLGYVDTLGGMYGGATGGTAATGAAASGIADLGYTDTLGGMYGGDVSGASLSDLVTSVPTPPTSVLSGATGTTGTTGMPLGSGASGFDSALTTGTYVDPMSTGSITGVEGLPAVTPANLAATGAITGLDTTGLAAAGGTATALSPSLLAEINAALGTNLTSTDLMRGIGTLGSSLVGAYASNQQSNQLSDLANRYEGYGAQYRQRLSDLYANPDSFLQSKEVQTPVQLGTNNLMRSLSTQGNPFGSGNALQQGQSYASDQLFSRLGQEKDRLAGFGGLSAYNQAAPAAQSNAIQSGSNAWNSLGYGVNNIFNPPQSSAQTMADFFRMAGGR